MKKSIIILFLVLFCGISFAQKKHTISGYIKDEYSGETLIGATITVKVKAKGLAAISTVSIPSR
jgi:hypothetical protein